MSGRPPLGHSGDAAAPAQRLATASRTPTKGSLVSSTPASSQAAPPAARRPSFLPSLTGLRFLAAAGIFLFHGTNFVLFSDERVGAGLLAAVTMAGWGAMTFFFMLSGFVLTWVAPERLDVRAFWRRRTVRIVPSHLLLLVVAGVVATGLLAQPFDLGAALLNATLLQAWSPDLLTRIAFNSPSWSLSAEMFFYLCFPVLLLGVRALRGRWLLVATGGVLAAILVVVPALVARLPHAEVMPFIGLSDPQFWILFHFPPARMLEFTLGMLLATIVRSGIRVPVPTPVALAVLLGAYVTGPLFPPVWRTVAVLTPGIALVIVALAQSDIARGRPGLLGRPTMVRLGDIAFAFYLVHMQVLIVGSLLLGSVEPLGTGRAVLTLALLFAVSVAFSWVLYTAVETPMMRRFGRRRPAPSPAPAQRSAEPTDRDHELTSA